MTHSVSFLDCKAALVNRGGQPAMTALTNWREHPARQDVVTFVEGFTHTKLFTLSTNDVASVRRQTKHALGDIPKEHRIRQIEDFTAPFAFQHVFHGFIEASGHLPTWQEFRIYLQTAARHQWLDHIEPLKATLRHQYSDERISDAIQWRLGKLYYSSVREVDFLASMKEMGIALNYHLLADVLLRSDFWLDDIILSLRVPNSFESRKPHARVYLGEAVPPFTFVDCEIQHQQFGKLWLTSTQSKNDVAQRIRDAQQAAAISNLGAITTDAL